MVDIERNRGIDELAVVASKLACHKASSELFTQNWASSKIEATFWIAWPCLSKHHFLDAAASNATLTCHRDAILHENSVFVNKPTNSRPNSAI